MAFTVLLVDDDPTACNAMERAILDDARLRPLGPKVVQAASGEQGLAMFVNDRPQVIITDLIMAGMDGFAFCRAVREAPFGKDVGLIVISGIYKDPSLAVSLDRDVRAAFLSKPFSQAEIAEAVLACLRAPGRAVVSTGNATPQPRAATPSPIGEGRGAPAMNTPRPVATGFRATTPGPIRPVGTNPGRTITPGPITPTGTTPPPTAAPDSSGTLRFFPAGASSRASATLSGSLAERGVPKLLFDLTDGAQTGTLSLTRGKMRKEIYLRDGKVVGADSNLRQEALGTLLCAKGIIDERQLTYLLAETKARGHKMGAVLIELGWLSPEDVLQCLAAQARKRVTDCLRWEEGNWSFVPGDNFGDRIIEHDLEVERIIFMGLLRSATPDKLISRFDQNGASEVRLTRRFDHHRAGFEAVFGADITRVLAAGASIGSLALRDDSNLVITAIDTLLETGLAELSDPAQEPEKAPVANAWQSSLSLEKLGAEIGSRIDAMRTESPDEMFSPVPRTATPSPEEQDAFSQVAEEQDSGAMDVSLRATSSTLENEGADTGAPPPRRDPPAEALRQDVLRTYLNIQGKPLYEALGVSCDAPTEEVVAACAAKSAQFSPSALAGIQLSAADQAKVESVRAALDRAARVLANPQLRQNYDRTLALPRSCGASRIRWCAELAFGEGLRLFNADKVAESLPKFEAAVRARPDQALYHAYLGWAQFVAFGQQWAGAARDTLHQALRSIPIS